MKLQAKLFLPIILVASLAACGQEQDPAVRGRTGGAAKVVTQQVQLQHIVDEIAALGTARANESIEIQPRISSLIEKIVFEEGQTVVAGAGKGFTICEPEPLRSQQIAGRYQGDFRVEPRRVTRSGAHRRSAGRSRQSST